MNRIFGNAQKMIAGELPPSPIGTLIGFRLVSIEAGRAQFALDTDARMPTRWARCTEGILCDIADSAMGMAYASTLEKGES